VNHATENVRIPKVPVPYTYLLAILLLTNEKSGSNHGNYGSFSEGFHSFLPLTTVNRHHHRLICLNNNYLHLLLKSQPITQTGYR